MSYIYDFAIYMRFCRGLKIQIPKKKTIFLVINNIDLYICSVKKIICRHYYRTDLTVKRKAMPEAVRRQIQTRLEKSKGADAEKLILKSRQKTIEI